MSNSNRIIILTGPESTGKTSIAMSLAKYFRGIYIEEYARTYVANLNREYNFADIDKIAVRQKQVMNETIKDVTENSDKVYFFDTHLIITKVWMMWSEHVYSKWIDKEIHKTKGALYLLCNPDIDWQPDKLRENGGDSRVRLYNEYKSELKSFGLKYKELFGIGDERILRAIKIVEDYLSK